MVRLLMVMAGMFLAANVYSALDIVKDGKSDWRIIVAPQPLPVTLRAAEDLQLYIKKTTGAELPIEKTGTVTGGKNIVIGDCDAARKAGISAAGLKPEGFVIITADGNLYIAGKDTKGDANSDHWRSAPQAGTWNGVSAFLEKYLDIRWFFPGEYGEYVPEHKNLTLDDINISDYPKMEYRRMTYVWWDGMSPARIAEVKNWERRNKNGWSTVWSGSHTWLENFRGEDYFKAHPEWFAEVNGQRLAYNGEYGLQMCTTNPKGLDKFADIIIKTAPSPGYEGCMFSLSPNDSGNFCECKKCRALDVEKLPDGKPVLTDRMVTYCNETAKRVNKVLPEQTFGFYAYSYYMLPPRKTALDPHVKVMHVLNDVGVLYYSDKMSESYLNNMLLPWKKMTGTLYFYSHPEGNSNMVLPCMHKGAIKKLYVDLDKAGVTGFSMNCAETFNASALNNYLYLKMAWNPRADIDAVYADALNKCYGEKAAPYVRQYFDALEQSVAKYADAIKVDYAIGAAKRYPDMLDQVYDGLYQKGIPFLKQAAAAPADKNQKYRLQMLIDNLEYCRDTVELYKLSQKIIKAPVKDKKDVLNALELSKKRLAYLENLKMLGWLNLPVEESTEKGNCLSFSPKVYLAILSELEGGGKMAGAVYLKNKTAVTIDGKLDEPFWSGIPALKVNLNKDDAEPCGIAAMAKVCYDKDYLYIGVRCEEPLTAEIKDSCRVHDGPVWDENELEFFFDINNAQKDFKQILVNTLGTITDVESINGKGSMKWESDAQVTVAKDADSWTLEMRVPFKTLGGNIPHPGAIWGFNICRVRNTVKPSEYTCWNPTFGGFGKPERFGKLIFR
ncbi:MAG: DUF4838 domain-containing protein [Victivallaceae bacterium]